VIYLEEFFALTKKVGLSVKPLLPKEYEKMMTTRKTLTYSRNDQVVGREIYCIEFSKD